MLLYFDCFCCCLLTSKQQICLSLMSASSHWCKTLKHNTHTNICTNTCTPIKLLSVYSISNWKPQSIVANATIKVQQNINGILILGKHEVVIWRNFWKVPKKIRHLVYAQCDGSCYKDFIENIFHDTYVIETSMYVGFRFSDLRSCWKSLLGTYIHWLHSLRCIHYNKGQQGPKLEF